MEDAGLAAFNALPGDVVTERLAGCLRAPGWVGAVAAGRPYPNRAELLAAAHRYGGSLDDRDLEQALAAHPRIGERPPGPGEEAARSRAEQGGVDADDARLAAELRAGNEAYEERFGHVFLIRAAGRSGPEILAALTERLGNEPSSEARVVRDQLAQIAQLRLTALLDELGS